MEILPDNIRINIKMKEGDKNLKIKKLLLFLIHVTLLCIFTGIRVDIVTEVDVTILLRKASMKRAEPRLNFYFEDDKYLCLEEKSEI